MEIGPGRRPMLSPPGFAKGGIAAPQIPQLTKRFVDTQKTGSRTPLIQTSESSFWGRVSHRSDLLDNAHRPLTLQEYRQALKRCEKMLQEQERDWGILNPRGRSYMSAISERQRVQLGEATWSQPNGESQFLD